MTVVVITGGDPIDDVDVADIDPDAFIVAADSGLDRADEVGLVPDLVVGDLDSVDPETLARHPGAVDRHPTDKDATDLELALRAARARAPGRILVLGGGGGRLDHLLGNALAVAAVEDATVEWRPGHARVHVVRDHWSAPLEPGALLSLVPIGGPVTVASTAGLRWALSDDVLDMGTTRGVSNEVVSTPVSVHVGAGVLLVVVPRSDPTGAASGRSAQS